MGSLGADKAKNGGGGRAFPWHIPLLSQEGSPQPREKEPQKRKQTLPKGNDQLLNVSDVSVFNKLFKWLIAEILNSRLSGILYFASRDDNV